MQRGEMTEPETYADIQALEEKFIDAGDAERLRMLASGEAPASDRLLYLALQALARTARGEPLEGK